MESDAFLRFLHHGKLFLDENKSFYKAMGNRWMNHLDLWRHPEVFSTIRTARTRTHAANSFYLSDYLLGGTLVVGPGDTGILYEHREKLFMDFCDLDQVRKAVEAMFYHDEGESPILIPPANLPEALSIAEYEKLMLPGHFEKSPLVLNREQRKSLPKPALKPEINEQIEIPKVEIPPKIYKTTEELPEETEVYVATSIDTKTWKSSTKKIQNCEKAEKIEEKK
eukprot:456744_1